VLTRTIAFYGIRTRGQREEAAAINEVSDGKYKQKHPSCAVRLQIISKPFRRNQSTENRLKNVFSNEFPGIDFGESPKMLFFVTVRDFDWKIGFRSSRKIV
jgi:hypothetical protein